MFDSVYAFARGLHSLKRSVAGVNGMQPPLASLPSNSMMMPSPSGILSSQNPMSILSTYSSSYSNVMSTGGSLSYPSSGPFSANSFSTSSLRSSNASCETEIPWIDGTSLYNYINSVWNLDDGMKGKRDKDGKKRH